MASVKTFLYRAYVHIAIMAINLYCSRMYLSVHFSPPRPLSCEFAVFAEIPSRILVTCMKSVNLKKLNQKIKCILRTDQCRLRLGKCRLEYFEIFVQNGLGRE